MIEDFQMYLSALILALIPIRPAEIISVKGFAGMTYFGVLQVCSRFSVHVVVQKYLKTLCSQ